MTVVNDSETLRARDQQVTTINYSCSSVSTPCKGAKIELTLPGPITPSGLNLTDQGYTVIPVAGDTVARTDSRILHPAGEPRLQRYTFIMKDPIPAGTSDRIQVTWNYLGSDAPNNSTTTQNVVFSASNAETVEDSRTTTWTATTDLAIEKSGPKQPKDYPPVGGEATYKVRYG